MKTTLIEGVIAVALVGLGLSLSLILGKVALLLVSGTPSIVVALMGVVACVLTHHFTAVHHTREPERGHKKGADDGAVRGLQQDRRTPRSY